MIVMLPFQPEPLSQLRARYQAALITIQDCRERIPDPLPSELREHVFDCKDGLRLIVSRDRETEVGFYLHLSASLDVGCVMYESLACGTIHRQHFINMVLKRFREISDDFDAFELLDWSPRGIPHWRRRLEIDVNQ